MSRTNSLSATNLAVHHHLNCDLYLHNAYHEERTAGTKGQDKPLSELSKAQFKRGLDWESTLYSWLDRSELLLKVPCIPLEAKTLIENIQADDRDHFFITGLTFWPPEAQLNKRFLKTNSVPVIFGLAKPDLLEITRTSDGVTWKVVDAKASKSVKTSHHVQIYFYTLCLSYILDDPFFTPSGEAGVWLPPKQGFHSVLPSFKDVKTISISLLESSLNYFLFFRLPSLLSLSLEDVSWHFNPLCRGCNYETQCRSRASNEGEIGSAPNISIDDARSLKDLLQISFSTSLLSEYDRLTDIEDLHTLIAKPGALNILDRSSPSLTKKARRVLGLPRKRRVVKSSVFSPVIQAARSNKIQVIPRRNFTCPSEEDVAFVISLILDPSSPGTNVEFFCITAVGSTTLEMPTVTHGTGASLIAALARYIRTILTLAPIPRTQFYVWSAIEQASLQSHLINAALISVNDADVRLCIGALAQGASLLQTTFQPLLLSGALLSFLSKGKMLKADYQACLERMDLSTTGKFEELRQRLDDEIRKIQLEGESLFENGDHRREFGQLPRVVVLKKEVESLLALPTPGYWELPDCARVLLAGDSSLPPSSCPSDEEIFRLYKMESSLEPLQGSLLQRNDYIYSVLAALRSRVASHDGPFLLVNEAKVLSSKFMDLCRQDTLRKLFFMQQFEVLSKLNELWKSRIDGCPDAPVLEYKTTTQGAKGIIHVFRLVSGTVDIRGDKDQAFYDHILVEDVSEDSDSDKEIPVEALFDDLAVSGLLFPLNRYTKANWQLQHPIVQRKLAVVDLKNVTVQGDATTVSLHIWGTWEVGFDRDRHYRLSPRLVDFNTAKSLAALFELDLQCSTHQENPSAGLQTHHDLPFLRLILDPKSFDAIEDASQYLRIENDMQRLFRDLRDLGNTSAGALVLKSSQHRAARRILSNRLSVIWGPPGTGKTYTISLSLLRLLEVQRRLGDRNRKIVFITAMTHAAIDACRNKLLRLIDHYQDIESLPTQWLSDLKIEQVLKGNNHPAPPKSGSGIRVYTGTIYQACSI
ncbi:hypothetical protein BDQ12DRAFT_695260 [Crucibulum laeve]|uniref:DNA2/NAM7 helicase helicase domain-containing protein n=1 Tax=Crucibulum laeve TaxID=68775 RepID=A0A5C3MJ58_9AGAR|nr:hypothetical protein BDQ12DRAFT_695260 [Crucibulum laeve]